MRKTILLKMMIFTFFLSSCSLKNSEIEHKDSEIFVRTHKVALQKNTLSRKYIGVVKEEMAASISFSINGNVDKVHVSEGSYVEKGELLAELNAYSLQNMHNAALATLKQAEDAMERIQMLYDNKSLPEIQYIEMQTNLEKARAAEAIARKNLNDSRLYAPFSGVIGDLRTEIGENVLPNQPVLSLLKIDNVEVRISVPEKEVNILKIGQEATIDVSAADAKSYTGKISKKGVVADRISHTYPLQISVKNHENKLLPGMVSDVSLACDETDEHIIIPNQCILKDGDGNTYVWMILNNQAYKQSVVTGLQRSAGAEILEGLSVDDVVVVDGYQKLSTGIKVAVL